jgi:hypothetical protein
MEACVGAHHLSRKLKAFEADGLRLLIVVGACSAFVAAVLRNHAEIVLAHANRESPKSAALPFPQGSHSLGPRSGTAQVRGSGVPASTRTTAGDLRQSSGGAAWRSTGSLSKCRGRRPARAARVT